MVEKRDSEPPLAAEDYTKSFQLWRRELKLYDIPYATLPRFFLDYLPTTRLKPNALRVYLFILLWAVQGEFWKKVPEMAACLNMSERNVWRGLKDLEEIGLVASLQPRARRHRRYYLIPYGNSQVGGHQGGTHAS